MSKRKNFKDLFGGDDSDEENEQTGYSKATTMGREKSKSESAQNNNKYTAQDLPEYVRNKGVQQKDYSNMEKSSESIEKEINSREELNITTKNQIKKKIKHEDNRLQNIFEKASTDKIEGAHEMKHQNGDGKKIVKLKKTEIGGLVVKLLTPAYVEKRFDSRDTFKMLARNISHALYDKDEHEIKEYIKKFLNKNEEFTSHTSL